MSKYFIEGDTLTDIADAIRLKRDIVTEMTPEDMALQVSLIDGGGGSVQEMSVNVPSAGTYSFSNKIAMGVIEDFDPDKVYFAEVRFEGDFSSATSSNPIVVWMMCALSRNTVVTGSYKQIVASARATGAAAYSNNIAWAATATAIDDNGTFYLYSMSGNTYTRLGAGKYTAKIYTV